MYVGDISLRIKSKTQNAKHLKFLCNAAVLKGLGDEDIVVQGQFSGAPDDSFL